MRFLALCVLVASVILSAYSEKPGCFSGKLDLVLVVDVSGSDENRFIANRDGALEIAKAVPISWDKVTIAVIQFSKLAIMKLEFGSSESWESVNDTISTLEWTGDVSQTAQAMDLAMIQFRRARPDAQRVIILFSDGNSFNSWTEVTETSERLHYSQAKIFAVSLGGNTYEKELLQYTSFSNGTIVRRQSDFQLLKKELLDMTVPRCPPPAAQPPPDFHRPESNPDGGDTIDQLPTRRTTPRRNPNGRARITRTTSPTTATAEPTTAAPLSPVPSAAPLPVPPVPDPSTASVPLPIDRRN